MFLAYVVFMCDIRSATLTSPVIYHGAAGASAGVAMPGGMAVVADDEESILRLYNARSGGRALGTANLEDFLHVPGKKQEADLEGAAECGGIVYWVGSHGTNKKGEFQLSRHCLFGTRIALENNTLRVGTVGRPYRTLINELCNDPRFAVFNLHKARYRPPKTVAGLNIEGLAVGPNQSLLIGFRGPLHQDKALIIQLLNPEEVIHGAAARFGDPILLDLKGRGIRDLAHTSKGLLILAGDVGEAVRPALFRLPEIGSDPELINIPGLSAFNPEGLITHPETPDRVQVLSDDDNKTGETSFRSFWIVFESGAQTYK